MTNIKKVGQAPAVTDEALSGGGLGRKVVVIPYGISGMSTRHYDQSPNPARIVVLLFLLR